MPYLAILYPQAGGLPEPPGSSFHLPPHEGIPSPTPPPPPSPVRPISSLIFQRFVDFGESRFFGARPSLTNFFPASSQLSLAADQGWRKKSPELPDQGGWRKKSPELPHQGGWRKESPGLSVVEGWTGLPDTESFPGVSAAYYKEVQRPEESQAGIKPLKPSEARRDGGRVNSPIKPVNSPIKPANSLIKPVNSPMKPANSPIKLVNYPIKPANSQIQSFNSSIKPAQRQDMLSLYEKLKSRANAAEKGEGSEKATSQQLKMGFSEQRFGVISSNSLDDFSVSLHPEEELAKRG